MTNLELKRFYSYVYINEHGCWEWLGTKNPSGYGQLRLDKPTNQNKGKLCLATRLSYEHFIGPLDKLCACHKCDNPSCVNPDHLFAGDRMANNQDMIRKGRGQHILTPVQVYKVRDLLESGLSQKAVGALLGVSQNCIFGISSGKTYIHVPDTKQQNRKQISKVYE